MLTVLLEVAGSLRVTVDNTFLVESEGSAIQVTNGFGATPVLVTPTKLKTFTGLHSSGLVPSFETVISNMMGWDVQSRGYMPTSSLTNNRLLLFLRSWISLENSCVCNPYHSTVLINISLRGLDICNKATRLLEESVKSTKEIALLKAETVKLEKEISEIKKTKSVVLQSTSHPC
jgi:hypothetical protein